MFNAFLLCLAASSQPQIMSEGRVIVKLDSSQATDRREGQIAQVSRLIRKGRAQNMAPGRSQYLLLERVRTTLDVACPECLCMCEE